MSWYHYVASFFAGVSLTNAVPHFVSGVTGNKFPTPFATPPGRGLSSPQTNVLWGVANLVLGALLARVAFDNTWSVALFFLGVTAMGMKLSFAVSGKAQ